MLNTFFENTGRNGLRIYSAVLFKGGEKISEYAVAPYDTKPQKPFRMYSATKSFVAIAILSLVSESKLSLNDKITKFFEKEFDLSNVHPYLAETTVENLLTMQTPFSRPTYGAQNKDWLASYFRELPEHPAGTVWSYDSCGSYVLGAIVKRVSGKTFYEYLRPIFDEIGVSKDVYCLKGPDGECWSGSGLIATTEDLARTTYLMLNGGEWNGKQLINKELVLKAISPLVPNKNGVNPYYTLGGYGYQIWCLPDGGFYFNGMNGQIAIGFPDRDLVFACNSDLGGLPDFKNYIIDAVYRDILPHFPKIKETKILKTAITPPADLMARISSKEFIMNENNAKITSLSLCFKNGTGELKYIRNGKDTYFIPFDLKREIGFVFPEKYTGTPLFDEDNYINYNCRVKAEWIAENQFILRIYATDQYIGNMVLCFGFKGDEITVLGSSAAQFFFDNFKIFTGGKLKK